MKKTTTLLLGLFLSAITFAQTVLLNENFDTGIPGTWTVGNGGSPGSIRYWKAQNGYNPFGLGIKYVSGTTQFAFIETENNAFFNYDTLYTPVINASGYTTLDLEWDQVYDDYNSPGKDQGFVQVYDGSAWQTVLNLVATDGSFLPGGSPSHKTIDIATQANSNLKIRFVYVNDALKCFWWAIDNVKVSGTAATVAPTADFSTTNPTPCTNETITIEDQSTGGPTSWSWSISPATGWSYVGGTTASSQDIQVKFTATGQYSVTLNAMNGNGSDAETKTNFINVAQQPTSNAGIDMTVCADTSSVQLNGSVTSPSGTWTSSGSGTFTPSTTTLNASYNFSANDKTNGFVNLILNTTGSTCPIYKDTLLVTIVPAPTVNAGPSSINKCENNPNVNLNATYSNATGVTWIGGTGVFSPSRNVANPTYTPNSSELLAGSVTLTAQTTGNGLCKLVEDMITINFTPAPTIDAVDDFVICTDTITSIPLTATYTIATGVNWSTAAMGTFSPNATTTNAFYNWTAADTANGTVTIYCATTGMGNCLAEMDTVVLTLVHCPGVGINENALDNHVKIYPNPSEGAIFIENSNESEVLKLVVFNSKGQKMIEKLIVGYQEEIKMEEHGIYFLQLSDDKLNITTKKILIVK